MYLDLGNEEGKEQRLMSKFQVSEAGSVDKMETQRRDSLGKEVSSVLDMWSLKRTCGRQGKLSNKKLFVLFYKSGEKSGLDKGLESWVL